MNGRWKMKKKKSGRVGYVNGEGVGSIGKRLGVAWELDSC